MTRYEVVAFDVSGTTFYSVQRTRLWMFVSYYHRNSGNDWIRKNSRFFIHGCLYEHYKDAKNTYDHFCLHKELHPRKLTEVERLVK